MTNKGRPCKLTPALQEKIVELLELGIPPQKVCDRVNIAYSTYREWVQRGNGENPKDRPNNEQFADFSAEVNEAIAIGEINLLQSINNSSKNDWRAAAWILERRFPDRWSNNRRVKEQADKKVEQLLNNLFWLMPSDSYADLLKALSQIDSFDPKIGEALEMMALKKLMESGWIEKKHTGKIGKAYVEMKQAIASSIN